MAAPPGEKSAKRAKRARVDFENDADDGGAAADAPALKRPCLAGAESAAAKSPEDPARLDFRAAYAECVSLGKEVAPALYAIAERNNCSIAISYSPSAAQGAGPRARCTLNITMCMAVTNWELPSSCANRVMRDVMQLFAGAEIVSSGDVLSHLASVQIKANDKKGTAVLITLQHNINQLMRNLEDANAGKVLRTSVRADQLPAPPMRVLRRLDVRMSGLQKKMCVYLENAQGTQDDEHIAQLDAEIKKCLAARNGPFALSTVVLAYVGDGCDALAGRLLHTLIKDGKEHNGMSDADVAQAKRMASTFKKDW